MPVAKRTRRDVSVPYWQSECGRAVVYVGDCLEVMSHMKPDQFHAVVTDPPYGLEFMGKEWDAPWKNNRLIDPRDARDPKHNPTGKTVSPFIGAKITYDSDSYRYQEWFFNRAEAMLRVARPGAHLLSFGGTRMWHRMACAVEDANWEIRDTLMWVYGSGFPKSHDVSKGIDKLLGAEREVVGKEYGAVQDEAVVFDTQRCGWKSEYDLKVPATDDAKRWSGFGTALKPAVEPIVVARKSFTGSVAQCVLDNGCGGLNIDGCRVGTTGTDVEKFVATHTSTGSGVYQFNSGETGDITMNGNLYKTQKDGRWPANFVHDGSDEVVDLFPEQAGGGGGPKVGGGNAIASVDGGYKNGRSTVGHKDNGSAARFFYSAKADHTDRPHGKGATVHPTVKPLDLMKWLVRLVCARGGVVLDPFMGSGSTGCAAIEEGMWFVGIEQSREYADIAVGRLKLSLAKVPVGEKLEVGKMVAASGQTPPPPKVLR